MGHLSGGCDGVLGLAAGAAGVELGVEGTELEAAGARTGVTGGCGGSTACGEGGWPHINGSRNRRLLESILFPDGDLIYSPSALVAAQLHLANQLTCRTM